MIRPVIQAELDPTKPVQEICDVISAMLAYHADRQADILHGVRDAIDRFLEKLEGDEHHA